MFHLNNITLGSVCMLYHLCAVGSYEVVCYQMDKLILSFLPWLFQTLWPGQSKSLGCNRNTRQLEVLWSAGPLLPAWSSSSPLRSEGPLLPAWSSSPPLTSAGPLLQSWSSSSALRPLLLALSSSLLWGLQDLFCQPVLLTPHPLLQSSACMPLLHSLGSRNYLSRRAFHWITWGSRAALSITRRISVQTFYFKVLLPY